jgi:hypothetical protein
MQDLGTIANTRYLIIGADRVDYERSVRRQVVPELECWSCHPTASLGGVQMFPKRLKRAALIMVGSGKK